VTEESDVEPTYRRWTLAKWLEFETKEQTRRNVAIDRTQMSHERGDLPRGDETRGWRSHWRRGVFGALAGWAAGSLGAIIFMLAECAIHFECEREVHTFSFHPTISPPHPITPHPTSTGRSIPRIPLITTPHPTPPIYRLLCISAMPSQRKR